MPIESCVESIETMAFRAVGRIWQRKCSSDRVEVRMNTGRTVIARLSPLLFLLATVPTARLSAVEGIPRWEQVLNEVLERAEQERTSKEAGSPRALSARNPNPSVKSGTQGLRPVVKDFVRYFQGPGLGHYRASVNRLQAYRQMITRVLREEGLPPELLWVGLVESGYDPRARSPKNALGIWQLIPETATTFGLTVARRDERTDPEKSTHAAARYLKSLYARFGDWALALAAYNAGENRVQSAIEQAGDRDFWRLSASGMLPRETQAYVPAVMAAQFLAEGSAVEDRSSVYDDATPGAAKIALAPFSLSR